MVSSESYQFVSGDLQHGVQVKAIDRGYLSLPGEPATKTASWENLNELELLNPASGSFQRTQLPSTARMSFSNGMGGLSINHMDSQESQMGAHLPDKNLQEEALQTLHLMNPPYAGYPDSAPHANMVLYHHAAAAAAGQDNSLGYLNQLQQHYFGFSSSPALSHSPISHQSTVSSVYGTTFVPQSNSQETNLLSNGLRSNTWAAGSELSFLPLNDTARPTQPLATRLACMEPGQQQPNSSLSQLLSRPNPDGESSMFRFGVALGLSADNLQASPGSNQVLSLSLPAESNHFQLQSIGMPQAAIVLSNSHGLLQGLSEEEKKDDGYTKRWVGNSDQLELSAQSNHFLSACHSYDLGSSNRLLPFEVIGQDVPVCRGYLTGSKYLRAAQLLLEEVVSVGCVMKNNSKHTNLQSWIGGEPPLDSSLSQDKNGACEMGVIPKEVVACVVPMMQNALTSSSSEQNLAVAECKLQENQELQLKKAKLMAMLDEVDRRYKLYFGQMEAVTNTFESAAGLGAAKTYTAMALHTISKHFRGLRDAIGSQIQVASKALGEDDSSLLGLGRLCFADQQLHQQRGLQQFGMMQQHAWRPQRGLPERSVSVLRAWLFDHFLHPYPKDADKHMLARQTGLSRNQVSNWFINARVRLWKPMVEEMYLEELKESDMDRTSVKTSVHQKCNTKSNDNHSSGISSMENRAVMVVPEKCDTHGRDEVGIKDLEEMQLDKQIVPRYQPLNSSLLQHSSGLDSGESQLLEGIIKGRNAGVFTPYNRGFQPEDVRREETLECTSSRGFLAGGLNHLTYGSYLDQGESFSRMPARYNGVSLTLGLQHPEGVSHAGAQQQLYHQQQRNNFQTHTVTGSLFSQLAMAGSRRRLDEVDDPSIDCAKKYEDLEEMQTRKRFAPNIHNHR